MDSNSNYSSLRKITTKQSNKKLRKKKVKIEDILKITRIMWRREEKKKRSEMPVDRDFRELFGYGDRVVLSL